MVFRLLICDELYGGWCGLSRRVWVKLIEELSGRHDPNSTESLEGLQVLFVAGHQEICVCGQGTLQDAVILVMHDDAREFGRWSDGNGQRVDLSQSFLHLRICPFEGLTQDCLQFSQNRWGGV